jgi:hypothetical protein
MIITPLLKKINLYYQLTKNLQKLAAGENINNDFHAVDEEIHTIESSTPLSPEQIKDRLDHFYGVDEEIQTIDQSPWLSHEDAQDEKNVAKLEFIEKWFNDYFQELEKEINKLNSQQLINEKISDVFGTLTAKIQ